MRFIFNFIDDKGNILFDQSIGWIDILHNESCGYRLIYSNNKGTNYIDKEGNILSPEWFPIGYDFENGFAIVKKKFNGEYYVENYLKTDGTFLSDQWFYAVKVFDEDGFADVLKTKDGEWCKIDSEGNIHE